MLALCVFIICSLTLVYLEVIAIIYCYFYTRKTVFYYRRYAKIYIKQRCLNLWYTTKVLYLMYMYDISYIKCQHHYMNYRMGLTSPEISHDTGSSKLNH